jgi:hypothetical protein
MKRNTVFDSAKGKYVIREDFPNCSNAGRLVGWDRCPSCGGSHPDSDITWAEARALPNYPNGPFSRFPSNRSDTEIAAAQLHNFEEVVSTDDEDKNGL